MRVLYVVPNVPSATRVRSFGFIGALSRLGHHVHVVALRPPEDAWAPIEPLKARCVGLELFGLTRQQTLMNALRAVPSRLPLQAAYGRHAAAWRRIRALVATGEFDVLHVEHLRGALLAQQIAGIPIVLDAVDSISLLFDHARRGAPGWRQRAMARLDLGRTRRFEARLPFFCDRLVVTSSRDRDAFVALAGPDAAERISVVPNGVATAPPADRRSQGPDTIVFSGKMSYHANAAAADALVREIMPRVWASRADVRLVIAGRGPSRSLVDAARDPRIAVTGFVDDLESHIRAATVAVAPLPYAVGVQNKVLEAMACGVPVVASRAAAQGIDATDGRDWLVAGDSADLAAAILRLLDDRRLQAEIGRAGREFVDRHHRWEQCAGQLVREYSQASERHQDAPLPAISSYSRRMAAW
jgi:glycosyltransferase involved in cell wall biosynthesis